jgi:hypothetical protein
MLPPPRGHVLRLAALFIGVACIGANVELRADDPVTEVGKTVTEWVKTRAEIVKLEESWKQEKALLGAMAGGLEERADSLKDKRDHLLAATAEERAEIAALTAKRSKAQESLKTAETRLDQLSAELIAMRPRLPPRLSDALEMAYRSLGSDNPSPGERMQLAMTVLNRCAQFNAGFEHGQEIIQFTGESGPVAVDVVYWGLSHGYALDRVSGRAWMGAPDDRSWRWEPLEGAAEAVGQLMAVLVDEADPALTAVPARVDAATGGGG